MSQAGELCRQWSWSVDSICKLLDAAVQCLTAVSTSSFDSKFIEAQLRNQWLPRDAYCIPAIDMTHPYKYEDCRYSQRINLLCDSLTYLMLMIEGGACRPFGRMAEKSFISLDRQNIQLQRFECDLSKAYECSLQERPVMTIEQRFIMCLTSCLSEGDEMYNVLMDEINCFLIFRVEMHSRIDRLHQCMNDVEYLRSRIGSCDTLHTLRDIDKSILGLGETDDIMVRLCHNLSLTYPKIRDLCRAAYCQEILNTDIQAISDSVDRL